ncbi:MAG: hydrogenase iron-sulfur subunit [Thermoplasmata archaeon]
MVQDSLARPKILVFSTNAISDMGIDLAGSSHLEYSPSVRVISVPCSGGIDPAWVLHALRAGFHGVFIAADGPECSLLSDCVGRTSRVMEKAQALLKKNGIEPARVKMAGVCSVCSESFVHHMEQFGVALANLPLAAEGR